MATNRGSGGAGGANASNAGFGVRNFLRDTLAAKPAFLDAIKAHGQEIKPSSPSSSNNANSSSSGSGKKPRANSLLPGDSDLIDQKSLFDADNVIAEVDFYLNRVLEDRPQKNSMLEKLKKLSRVPGPKVNQQNSQYNQLVQRLTNAETKLKAVVNDAVAQESSFTLQALHLTIRVKSCIEFNKESLPKLRTELEEVQALEADLENGTKLIQSMGRFQGELQNLNEAQYKYVPAALRPKPNPEDVRQTEQFKTDITKRLRKLEKVSSHLTILLFL